MNHVLALVLLAVALGGQHVQGTPRDIRPREFFRPEESPSSGPAASRMAGTAEHSGTSTTKNPAVYPASAGSSRTALRASQPVPLASKNLSPRDLAAIFSTDNNNYNALFQRRGDIYEIEGFLALRIPVSLDIPLILCESDYVSALADARQTLAYAKSTLARNNNSVTYNVLTGSLAGPLIEDTLDQLDRFCARAYAWARPTSSFSIRPSANKARNKARRSRATREASSHSRPPRGISAVGTGLLAAAAGTIFGSISSSWHSNAAVRDELTVHWHSIQELTSVSRSTLAELGDIRGSFTNLGAAIQVLEAVRAVHRRTSALSHTLDQIEDCIVSAYSERLTFGVISATDLPAIFGKIKDAAAKHAFHVPIDTALQLLELPVSFMPEERGFTLEMFVPLVAQRYDLVQLADVPLYVDDGTDSPLLLDVRPRFRLLAVHPHLPTNAPMHTADLDKCYKLGGHFLCSDLVKRPAYKSTCIGGLYHQDEKATARLCDFKESASAWSISPKSNGSFIVTTTFHIPSTVSCVSLTSGTIQTGNKDFTPGQHEFHLAPGCSLICEQFTVRGGRQSVGELTLDKTLVWNATTDILQNLTLADLRQATASLRAAGANPPESVKAILKLYESLPKLTARKIARFTSAGFFTQALAIAICLVLGIRCANRTAHRHARKARTDSVYEINRHNEDIMSRLRGLSNSLRQLKDIVHTAPENLHVPSFHDAGYNAPPSTSAPSPPSAPTTTTTTATSGRPYGHLFAIPKFFEPKKSVEERIRMEISSPPTPRRTSSTNANEDIYVNAGPRATAAANALNPAAQPLMPPAMDPLRDTFNNNA